MWAKFKQKYNTSCKCLCIVSEGSEEGFITWKFDLTDSGAIVDTVHVQCSTWLRDTGQVVLKICSSETCTLVPGGMTVILCHATLYDYIFSALH